MNRFINQHHVVFGGRKNLTLLEGDESLKRKAETDSAKELITTECDCPDNWEELEKKGEFHRVKWIKKYTDENEKPFCCVKAYRKYMNKNNIW